MKKKVYNISVKVLTGLHIGAGNDTVQIGGVDSAVMKDPVSKLPYIPGSSLKGKLRCLLETEGGYAEMHPTTNTLFGPSNDFLKKNKDYAPSPTRFIFRDLFIEKPDAWLSGEIATEVKTEIKIDRTKGSAQDGALRSIERVPPGTVFTGNVLVRYTDENDLAASKQVLDAAVSLLATDALGGSGSRGYGAVEVTLS